MSIGDLKNHGKQCAAISAINLCAFIVGAIVALTLAGLIAERRERQVEARVAAARIEAARQVMRVTECGWRDIFATDNRR